LAGQKKVKKNVLQTVSKSILLSLQTDYSRVIQETGGALWDLGTVMRGRGKQVERVVEELITQARATREGICPAA